MPNSMQHLNGAQMCVIDTETTGLTPFFHEVIQVAIVPLDSTLEPRRDVSPFYIELKPDHPDRIDPQAMTVNRMKAAKIGQRGFDRFAAQGMLERWVDTLGLPYFPSGGRKRLIPVGHNYGFDQMFMIHWLGFDLYSEIFDSRFRDTMIVAAYLNDNASFHAREIEFNKLKLSWLANKLKVPLEDAHDALGDCVATAKIYKKLVLRGLL